MHFERDRDTEVHTCSLTQARAHAEKRTRSLILTSTHTDSSVGYITSSCKSGTNYTSLQITNASFVSINKKETLLEKCSFLKASPRERQTWLVTSQWSGDSSFPRARFPQHCFELNSVGNTGRNQQSPKALNRPLSNRLCFLHIACTIYNSF